MSNTPRGSPTPEDAECAAIIQAVIHAVSQTIRINPSPPPEALDFMSGSMLPTIDRPKFPDLKCIDGKTLHTLILGGDVQPSGGATTGGWKERFSKFMIVDCRFDYEFSGGHIRNATHCSKPKDIITQFLKEPPTMDTLPVCLVFHCEFSKNRAPKM